MIASIVAGVIAVVQEPDLEDALVELGLRIVTRIRARLPESRADDRLVSISELARRLGCSVAHVRRLDPPHVAIGARGTRRYDVAAVRAWLAERDPKPTTSARRNDVDVAAIIDRAGLSRVR